MNQYNFDGLDDIISQYDTSGLDDIVSQYEGTPAAPAKSGRKQNEGMLGDMVDMWGIGSGKLVSAAGWLFDSETLSQLGDDTVSYYEQTLSDAQKDANSKRFVEEDFSVGDAVFDPRSWAGTIVQSLPMMAPGLGAAGLTAKGAVALGASRAAAVTGASLVGSASEGLVIGATVGDEVYREVMSADEDMLRSAPYYQDLIAANKPPEEARKLVAEKASESAALPAGVGGAILGAAFNKFVGDAVIGNLSKRMARETFKGGLLEGTTEVAQGGLESYASQSALNEYTGKPFDPAGAANQMVGGFGAGVALGGAVGAAGSLNGRTEEQARADAAREEAAKLGGDSLDQTVAASEELVKPSPLEGFGSSEARKREIQELRERRMQRLMDAQGNLDSDYFKRGNVPTAPDTPVEFETPSIPKAQSQPAFQANGSEIEFESVQPGPTLSMAEDQSYDNAIDFEPQRQVSRTDELAQGIEMQVRAREAQPQTGLLPAPDSIKLEGPVAGNANTGLDQVPEKIGRMDSDPVERAKLRKLSLENDAKREVRVKRRAAMPENLQDNRLLNPAYRTELESEAKRFTDRHETNKRKDVVNTRDDLFTAIAKLGGLNKEELVADGVDPADMKGSRAGIRPVFRKGGRSLDDMAEALMEEGYVVERDVAELRQKVDAQLSGTTQRSQFYEGLGDDNGFLPDDLGTNTEIAKSLNKALRGEKLSDKQLGIVQKALDSVNEIRNEQIDTVQRDRIERNEFRRAVRDYDEQVSESILASEVSRGNAEAQPPLEVYAEIDRMELSENEPVSQTEVDVAAAEFYGLDSGLTENTLDALSERYSNTIAYVQSIYREAQNARNRQSQSETLSQVPAREEAAGRESPSQNQEVVGSGQRDRGRSAGSLRSDGETQTEPQQELLSAYTEADLQAQESRKQAEIQANKQAAQKAEVDEQVGSFELTGSDRASDANSNQNDLFGDELSPSKQASKADIEFVGTALGDTGLTDTGKPFKTAKAARLMAKKRGIENYRIVEGAFETDDYQLLQGFGIKKLNESEGFIDSVTPKGKIRHTAMINFGGNDGVAPIRLLGKDVKGQELWIDIVDGSVYTDPQNGTATFSEARDTKALAEQDRLRAEQSPPMREYARAERDNNGLAMLRNIDGKPVYKDKTAKRSDSTAPEHAANKGKPLDPNNRFEPFYPQGTVKAELSESQSEAVQLLEMDEDTFSEVLFQREGLFESIKDKDRVQLNKTVDKNDIVYAPEPIQVDESTWEIKADPSVIKELKSQLDDYVSPEGGERITIKQLGPKKFEIASNYNNRYTEKPQLMWDKAINGPSPYQAARKESAGKLENAIKEAKGMWLNIHAATLAHDRWVDAAIDQAEDTKTRQENSTKTILSLFDYTGSWAQPWADAGYNVIPLDIQNGHDVTKIDMDYLTETLGIEGEIYGILAACPCTDFTSAGARHFAAKDADGRTEASKELVISTLDLVEMIDPKFWVLENPVGRIRELTGLPNWRLSFDPWAVGHAYTKQTLLWGNFKTDMPTSPVDPIMKSIMHTKYGGKSLATKNARSKTPEGFAASFFMANNHAGLKPQDRLLREYPMIQGPVKEAFKAGLTEEQIVDAVEYAYGDFEYDKAVDELLRAVAESKGITTKTETDVPDVAQPEQVEAEAEPQTYIGEFDALWGRANNADETLTVADVVQFVEKVRDSETDVKAELNKMTKPKLERYYNGYYDRSMKKDRLVKSVYEDLATSFKFLTTTENSMIIGGTGISSPIQSTIDKLNEMSDSDLQESLAKRKAKRDERRAEFEKQVEGIRNPETLEDFRNAVRSGASKDFTPEQWATYDRLHADDRIEKQEAARVKTVESVDGDVNYTLHEGKHTQKGHDLFIVSLNERVGSDMYRELNAKARQLGGYYSRYSKDGAIPGFQFKTDEARSDFLKLLEGESVEKTRTLKDKTETLQQLADRIEDRAAGSLNQERKTNTSKRAREAAYANERAEGELEFAGEIKAIANAIKSGEAKYLSKLSAKTELEAIRKEWNNLKYLAQRSEEGKALLEPDRSGGIARGDKWKESVTPEQKVRFAEYPLMRLRTSVVVQIAKDMMQMKGFKQAGLKLANDASKSSEDSMYLANHRHFDKLKEFAIKHLDYHYLTDVAKDYNRMQKLGIETLPMLRAALLEYNEIASGSTKKEVKSATADKLKYADFMGKYKDNDFFNTTEAPADQVIDLAGIEEGMTVFEPSAGLGHLADKAAEVVGKENVTTNELSFEMSKFLEDQGFSGTQGDFLTLGVPENLTEMEELADSIEASTKKLSKLNAQQAKRVKEGSTRARTTTYNANASNEAEYRDAQKASLRKLVRSAMQKGEIVPDRISTLVNPDYNEDGKYDPVESSVKQYDRVVMNPPFSKDQEITHIEHAYKFLKPGGRLVAITSSMAGERSNKRNQSFKAWLEELGAEQYPLPDGSFKNAINPTGVNTKIIVIDKPEDSGARFSVEDDSGIAASTDSGAISQSDADEVIDRITSAWRDGRAAIRLVESFTDLPDAIQQAAYNQEADSDKVAGVFHKGKVYIVRDRHTSVEQVEQTIFHEAYGHYGLRQLFGQNIESKMNDLFAAIGGSKGFNRLARKHGINLTHYAKGMIKGKFSREQRNRILMEELLAHIAQDQNPSLKKRAKEIIGSIRQWLRDHTFLKLAQYSESDLFALLKNSRDKVMMDRPVEGGKAAEQPMFSILGEDPEMEKLGLTPKQKKSVAQKINELANENWKQAFSEGWDRIYEGTFDGLYGLKKAEDAVGVDDLSRSGYVGARMASGVADTMHAVLHYGAPVWRDGILQHKEGTRGLLEIFGDLGTELNAWLAWMGANRAEELMEQGRENNLTREDIDRLKAQAFGREDRFEEVRQEYVALNRAMLDMAEEAGLIEANSRAQWESDYYVPFYRQTEGEADAALLGPRTKKGLSHQSAGIKALRGGEVPTNDLLENILQNWIKLTDSSMKNSAMLKTVESLSDTEYLTNETLKYTKALVPKSEIKKRVMEDRAYREMVADYLELGRDAGTNEIIDKMAKVDTEGFDAMWAMTAPTDPDVIRVQRGGKNEYYRVNDPALLRAVTHISNTGSNHAMMRGGRYMKSLLTTGVTASPDFILRNFIRDAVHAWAINPDKFRFGVDSFKGLNNAVKEDADYRKLMFAGASFQGGYVHGTDPERSAQIVRRALERKGLNSMEADNYMQSLLNVGHKGKNGMLRVWQSYRNMGDKVENANRLATFKAALEAGKPMTQAVYESKDLMDYSMRGNFAVMMALTDVVPFLNARLQGLSKLGRAAKTDRAQLTSAAFKISMFSFALAALNDDDERYQALPDWDKDANWHFWIGEDHWRIPKPFEIGVLFGTMPERIYNTVLTDNQPNEKLAWSLRHNLLHTFNVNPTPQAVLPIVEVVANRSFFFDTPIEGMADEGKLDEARYNERTSSTMKELGKLAGWMGLSPKELEHLWNGYLGTMGSYGLMLADLGVNALIDRPARPEWRIEDYPVVKSFYKGSGPAKSTQYMTDVYDRMKDAEEIYRTIRSYRQEGRKEDANELQRESKDKLRYRKALGLARQQLGSINKQRDRISRSTDLSAAEKRLKLDKLVARKNKIAKRFAELTDEAF